MVQAGANGTAWDEGRGNSLKRWAAGLVLATLLAGVVGIGWGPRDLPARLVNRYSPHAPSSPEEWARVYGYGPDELVEFTFDRGRGRPFFQGEVNGRPASLFFDSANAFGLTVPEAWVRQEGWRVTGERPHVVGGQPTGTFPDFTVTSLAVAGVALPISVGTSWAGNEASFGWPSLRGRTITLDYAHGRAAIGSRPLPESITPGRGRYVARYVSPEGYAGAVLIPTRVRGRQYLALVDTGASVTAIDRTLAEEWGLAPNLLGRVRLEGLEIGPFRLDVPSAALRPVRTLFRSGPRPSFVIGADVLCRFLVTFDYAAGRLILER